MWSERRARAAALAKRPMLFGLAVMLGYAALVLPMLVRHDFDTSVFIVAGDRFVAAGQTPAPIIVRPHSDGYDGQFYYRLALSPLLPRTQAFGVTLDHPAWRMQRILLPLLARLLAGARPALIPAALFSINLAGLFAIGWLAMRLARARDFPLVVPLAIVLWPGLLVALTHDTTEILAAALLLGGSAAWLARRPALTALLLGLASLTRETAILVIAGALGVAVWHRAWREAAWMAAAAVPFLAWRQFVTMLWQDAPQGHGVAHNAGWPLAGVAQLVLANVLNAAIGMAHRPRDLTARATALLSVAVIGWFCVRTACAAWPALGRDRQAGLAAGWLLILALMSMLTANGPWVEPAAWFRAFTECWLLGWLIGGLSAPGRREPAYLLAAGVPLFIRNIELCYIQLK